MTSDMTPYDQMVEFTYTLGLSIFHVEDGTGPSFIKDEICVEQDDDEMLAHELAHFLLAPEWRRHEEDYGHARKLKSESYRDREELAAAVLGMVLQLYFGGDPYFGLYQYLWNQKPEYFHRDKRREYVTIRRQMGTRSKRWKGDGFWIGAGILVKKGWLLDGFTLNTAKLYSYCLPRKGRHHVA